MTDEQKQNPGEAAPSGPPPADRAPESAPAVLPKQPVAVKAKFEDFTAQSAEGGKGEPQLDLIKDITLKMRVELGRCKMRVEDVLKLSSGKIVEMDKLTGDPLDVYVNDQLVARGEVLVINDNFAIRITEVVNPEKQ